MVNYWSYGGTTMEMLISRIDHYQILILVASAWAAWYMLFRFGKCKVIRVIDGDTVQIKGEKKPSRLYAIDAPESDQKYGDDATKYLSKLILGKWVKIKPCKGKTYDREIIKIFKWGDVNAKMVKSGNAIPSMHKDYEHLRRKVKFTDPKQHRDRKKRK